MNNKPVGDRSSQTYSHLIDMIIMNMTAFWFIAPRSPVEVDRRLRGAQINRRPNVRGRNHNWNSGLLLRD
jgi:hypothetical protein